MTITFYNSGIRVFIPLCFPFMRSAWKKTITTPHTFSNRISTHALARILEENLLDKYFCAPTFCPYAYLLWCTHLLPTGAILRTIIIIIISTKSNGANDVVFPTIFRPRPTAPWSATTRFSDALGGVEILAWSLREQKKINK